MTQIDRETRLKLAIYDYGTRPRATAKSVMEALKKEGFTREEISGAIREWTKGDRA